MSSNSGFAPELVLATGHGSAVVAAAVSPDGRTLATGSQDHSVILWDLESYEMLRPPLSYAHPWNLRFSADGSVLAAFARGEVRLWETATGVVRATWSGLQVNFLDLEDEDRMVATRKLNWSGTPWIGSFDLETRAFEPHWDTAWLEPRYLLRGGGKCLCAPDGTVIAGFDDYEVRLWEAELDAAFPERRMSRDRGVHQLRDGTGSVTRNKPPARWPERAPLAVDRCTSLWVSDTRTGRKTRLLGHGDGVWALAASPDGTILATSHTHGGLAFWSIPSGRVLNEGRPSPLGRGVRALAFTPDASRLVSTYSDKRIQIWETTTGQRVGHLPTLEADVFDLAHSPGRGLLASGHRDGTVRLWDTHTRSLVRTLLGKAAVVSAVAFTSDGRHLVVAGSDARLAEEACWIELWEVGSGEHRRTLKASGQRTQGLGISRDGELLVHTAQLNRTQVWNLRTGELACEFPVHCAAVSPDGATLAVAVPYQGLAVLRDALTGTLVRELECLPSHEEIVALRFSADGQLLFGSCGDQLVCWELQTGGTVWAKSTERGLVGTLAVAADGKTLAFGSQPDNTVVIWDIREPYPVERFVLNEHRGNVHTVAFSPHGATLATGSEDATIKLWDPVTGDLRMTLVVLPGDGLEPSGNWICHTPEGRWHGSPGAERFVRWAANGQFVARPGP